MSIYSDIDLSFTRERSGDIKKLKDVDAVSNAIKNIFTTRQFSRRMLQEFSLNPYNYLFEQIDEITARELGNLMIEAVNMWDDRVVIYDLLVKPEADKNQYNIHVKFTIKNIKESGEVDFIISRI